MGALLEILRGQVPAGVPLASLGKRAMSRPASFASGRGRRALFLEPGQREYSASAVAYRCVHYIASNMASLDLQVLGPDGEAVQGHEIDTLWNRYPNPVLSARAQKEVVFSRLELVGEQLLYIDRGETGTGPAASLWPIYDPVEIVVDERLAGELKGYVVKVAGGGRVPLLPSEVLWLRYPHPFEEWGALPPWKAAMFATEADAYARAWQRGEFQHGARPSSVVYLGDLSDEAHDAAVAEFEGSVQGAENAGRSLLVSSSTAAKVERLTLTPAEMSYLESRVANADEVMLAFGLRPDLFRGQATYENQRAAKVAAWSDTLLSKLEVVASETDRQLLPDLQQTAAFDVSDVDALRENADAVWGRIVSAMYPDLLVVDEGRAELGLEPLPNNAGQVTLSEYRARIALLYATGPGASAERQGGDPLHQDAPPRLPLGAAAGAGRARSVGALLGGPQRVRLYVGRAGLRAVVPGRTRRLELESTATRAVAHERTTRSVARVLAFYERHETIGQRAVKRLSRKQERVVLQRLRALKADRLGALLELYGRLAEQEAITVHRTEHSRLPQCDVPAHSSLTVGDVRVAADDVLDAAYWRTQTQEHLEAFMAGVWEGGAAQAADTLGLSLDLFDARVLEAMTTRSEVLAYQVTETTRRVLDAQLLQAGVEGGESIDQLAERVKAVFADLEGWRATAIARTETVGGFNAASRVLAVESGVVKGRTWLATNDDRVRDTHAAIDGETLQGMAGAYSNGLMHPGDPNGPPRETVNCRCVETYVLDEG